MATVTIPWAKRQLWLGVSEGLRMSAGQDETEQILQEGQGSALICTCSINLGADYSIPVPLIWNQTQQTQEWGHQTSSSFSWWGCWIESSRVGIIGGTFSNSYLNDYAEISLWGTQLPASFLSFEKGKNPNQCFVLTVTFWILLFL